MTHEKTKNNACVMVIASKALEVLAIIGLNTCEDEKMGEILAHVMSPALVLRAFSCELMLKALVAKEQQKTTIYRKLNDLYHELGKPTKDAIANVVINKMKKENVNYEMADFLTDLNGIADVFDDWRYFYENPQSLNATFLEALFNELLNYTLPTSKE